MKQKNSRLVYWLGIIIISAFLGFSLQFVRAWTEPTAAPPSGNVGAPVNTSDLGQVKSGSLIINSLGSYAIGLFVNRQVKIQDGFQGAGKVLTSDADGLASWQAPSGGALPVGSIYLSVVSTDPSTLLGYGTWEQVAKGKALIGQDPADADWDTAEETRGEKVHTLTQAELPSHYHTVNPPNTNTGGHSADHSHYVSGYTGGITANHTHWYNFIPTSWEAGGYGLSKVTGFIDRVGVTGGNNTGTVSSDHAHWWGAQTGGASANHTHAVDIAQFNSGSLGSGTAFNNLQPSFVIYVWKRTS